MTRDTMPAEYEDELNNWGITMNETKDRHFMRIAMEAATLSKCPKAQYGAVIVDKNGRVVGVARNGKPAGSINDGTCYRLNVLPNSEKSPCCLHAEANALMYCDRDKAEGGTMYVNGVPCRSCALAIMQAGLKRLVYIDAPVATGHKGDSNDEFWARYGIEIERVALQLDEADSSCDFCTAARLR